MYRFECWSSGLEASLGSLHIYGAQQLFIVLALIPSTIALMIATKLELQGIVDFQLVYNYKWVRQKKNYETSIEEHTSYLSKPSQPLVVLKKN